LFGITRRLNEHNFRHGRFTSNKGPWEILYQEKFETRASAMKREKFLKSGKGREFLKNILAP
jgi:putative endonuclease